jgi:hypothetical protein
MTGHRPGPIRPRRASWPRAWSSRALGRRSTSTAARSGRRIGLVEDPFGDARFLCSRVETVSPDEMQHRWTAMLGGDG